MKPRESLRVLTPTEARCVDNKQWAHLANMWRCSEDQAKLIAMHSARERG